MADEFKPWALQERIGTAMMIAGGGLGYIGMEWESRAFMVAGGIALVLGMVVMSRVGARKRGKRIEQKAIRGISLPDGWEMEANKLIPDLGDADLFIKGPNEKFVIEIKSHANVSYDRGGMFFGSEKLLAKGKSISPDPLIQAKKAAERLNATPVVWFPEAQTKKRFKSKDGILIVWGTPRSLLIGIGAKSWFSLF